MPKSKSKSTKSDLIKPPGTPVRIGATPEMAPGAGSSEECQSTEEICFVCSTVIREATAEREGDAALLCEGRHKRWAHTSCVGVSDVLYKDIQSCETPWMCRECSKEAAKALQELPLLQEEVKSLKAESTGLREELTEMRALVSSLHSSLSSLESKVSTVSATVDLLQSNSSILTSELDEGTAQIIHDLPAPQHPESTQAAMHSDSRHGCGGHGRPKAGRRQQRGSQRSKNVRSDHEHQEQSNQGGSSNDMPNSSQAMPNVTPNSNPKVPISGKRRVWGTMKSCGAQAVKNTISRLTSLTDQTYVKRKFKKVGSRTRWWHIITAAESELKTLEAEWSSVQLQTSWKLEPCFSTTGDAPTFLDQPQ